MAQAQLVNISPIVKLRKRVHRGTTAAYALVIVSTFLVAAAIGTIGSATWFLLLMVACGAVAVPFLLACVRPLRRRDRRAAATTVIFGAILAVALLIAAIPAPTALSYSIRDFLSGLASNFVVDNSYVFGQLSLLTVIPLYRHVRYTRRWRHPVLLFFGIFLAVAVVASMIATAIKTGLPQWLFAALILVSVIALALRTALRALHADRPPVGEWDGLGPLQGRHLFTGRQPVRVVLLIAVAALLWLIGFVVIRLPQLENLAGKRPTSTSQAVDAAYAATGFGLLFLWLGFLAYRQARGRAALGAVEVRSRDPRAPVLYLRQFSDEGLRIPAHGKGRRSLVERTLGRRTDRFEEVIVWHLWKFGPVVSVGRPGDKISPLGSAREYLPDHAWRAHVDMQMVTAGLVVVQLGGSDGIRWEIEQIQRVGVVMKTLFVIPPVEFAERQRRWTAFRTIASDIGWPNPPASLTEDTLMYRAVDGNWIAVVGYFTDEWNYEVAIDIFAAQPAAKVQSVPNARSLQPAHYPAIVAQTTAVAKNPPPGWYQDAHGVLRWWDGRSWTPHTQQRAHGLRPDLSRERRGRS